MSRCILVYNSARSAKKDVLLEILHLGHNSTQIKSILVSRGFTNIHLLKCTKMNDVVLV